MKPDFSKAIVDVLAKRAGYFCSNPDCRIGTVGPNADPEKATTIGEAAHIFGARQSAKRFNESMTDLARSSITNGVWLCRNCHKLIDSDESKYPPEILFLWREEHEKYVQDKLGNKTERLILEQQSARAEQFSSYPPLVKRIVIDKPRGWELRLSAELMRHLNKDHFRRLSDLKRGLYIRPLNHVPAEDAFNWVRARISDMSKMIEPLVAIVESLNTSWGKLGEHGDESEIHHVVKQISDYVEQIVLFEESLYFTVLPTEFEGAQDLLKNAIGSQVDKLRHIPEVLDRFVVSAEAQSAEGSPLVAQETITIDLPENWSSRLSSELERATAVTQIENEGIGRFSVWWWVIGILVLLIFVA